MGILFSWSFVQLGFGLCCARLLTMWSAYRLSRPRCCFRKWGTPMQTQICYNPHSGPGTTEKRACIFWEAPVSGSGYREFQLQKGLDAELMPRGRLMASGYSPKNLHPQTAFKEIDSKGIAGKSCTPIVGLQHAVRNFGQGFLPCFSFWITMCKLPSPDSGLISPL